jgi:hypothetical protein
MILNTYAVLDAFVSVFRLGFGVAVLGLALSAVLRSFRQSVSGETKESLEDRYYLLFLLAGFLLGLNVLAWPLLYLLLQCYVPEWPGIMCIYGVTRIGSHSLGVSRYLPTLLTALQVMKPVLAFLSGAWFVLHLLNRRTRSAPLTGRVLLVLLASALLATVDAATEVAYLAIPKKEEFLSAGCCTAAEDAGNTSRFLPGTLVADANLTWLYIVYYVTNLGLAAALASCLRFHSREIAPVRLALLVLAMLATLIVNAVFLTDAAAPRLLHMPNHHCPYDLISQAPESLAAVALFLGGCFCVGWACVAGWLGADPESDRFLPTTIVRLLRVGLLGVLASLLLMSTDLALA